jgi:hypothetical protein
MQRSSYHQYVAFWHAIPYLSAPGKVLFFAEKSMTKTNRVPLLIMIVHNN